jgi:toxin ParE1/3/4
MDAILTHTYDQFGARKHREYQKLIVAALAEIASRPNGPRARHMPGIHPDARTLHISRRGKPARHFFLYRVMEDEFIHIGRLLHDSMDLKRHLPKGFDPEPS